MATSIRRALCARAPTLYGAAGPMPVSIEESMCAAYCPSPHASCRGPVERAPPLADTFVDRLRTRAGALRRKPPPTPSARKNCSACGGRGGGFCCRSPLVGCCGPAPTQKSSRVVQVPAGCGDVSIDLNVSCARAPTQCRSADRGAVTPGYQPPSRLPTSTGDHSKQDQFLLVKIAKYVGFGVYRRSYLIGPPPVMG